MQSQNGGRADQRAPADGLKDLYSRTYPAIEAMLQRKAAIIALQQGRSCHNLPELSELALVYDHGLMDSHNSVCQFQAASWPRTCDSKAQPCSSSDTEHGFTNGAAHALPDPTLTGTADVSSCSRQQEQQQPAQTSAAADTLADPTSHQHSNVASKSANLYAEEFARLRQRHWQRTWAASTIQAAVRKWLAQTHTKQQCTLPMSVQDQYADRPHSKVQLDPAGSVNKDSKADSPAYGLLRTVTACPNCANPEETKELGTSASATNNTNNEPESTIDMLDNWEWQRCRKAVALRCKQVLKSQGAYGMAAEYHRLRVQGAVMFIWR